MPVGAGFFKGLRHRVTGVQPFDLRARQHQGGQQAVVEQKDVLHHLVLMLFNQAGAHALFQTGGDFFLGHGAAGGVGAC